MKIHTPTSDEKIGRFVDVNDALCVLVAGPLAFYLRDPNYFGDAHLVETAAYSAIAFFAGLTMLFLFHLGKNLSAYTSLRDVYVIGQVCLATAALTAFFQFVFSRLETVPRSLPIIHFLVLMMLMLAGRAVATRVREYRELRNAPRVIDPVHVLVIGANRLTWSYLRLISAFDIGRADIVAILDDDPKFLGRSLGGRPVLAPPSEIARVVDEYRVHGVRIDKVMIAANKRSDSADQWPGVAEYCAASGIALDYLGDMLGIELGEAPAETGDATVQEAIRRPYFVFKRVMDFGFSLTMLLLLVPILIPVSIGVMLDVGWPIVFWQKRVGRLGRPFLVYKLRTLRAPYDRHGNYVAEGARISRFGALLRRTRLDETPQLWNVAVGDMSFIGPRPLLPVDQPKSSKLRLLVLPGLTGWAQVHGGQSVSADEKGVLDDWYVEKASLGLDIQIVFKTIEIVLMGDKRMRERVSAKAAPSTERQERLIPSNPRKETADAGAS